MAFRDLTGAVDFDYLRDYLGGDEGLMDEVLAIFQQQAEMWAPLMVAEHDGWRDAAHTLKGAALGIGANTLAAMASEAEKGDALGAPDRLSRTMTELSAVLHDVAAFRHGLQLRSLKS